MQSLVPSANASNHGGIGQVLFQMMAKEGVLRPMRGISAVMLGAGPAHALYFSSYEYLRDVVARHSSLNSTLSSGELKITLVRTAFNLYTTDDLLSN